MGLLNKAAPVSGPRLDFDPDIVAALDDDFDFENPENILEDDFVLQANDPQKGGSDAEDEDEWEDVEDDSDENDSCSNDCDSEGPLSDDGVNGRMKEFLFMQEETRSRFTEYSMTSSVMRRNEQLTLLDDRFEKVRQLRKVTVKHKGAKCFFCLLIHLTVKMHTRWCPVCL